MIIVIYLKEGKMKEIYVAIMLKSDGTVPGLCSMLQIGLAIAGVNKEDNTIKYDDQIPVNFFTLKPIGAPWKSSTISNLVTDREKLQLAGEDVGPAMVEATAWLKEYARVNQIKDANFIPVSWPNTFDYAFIMHYFMNQNAAGTPFGISSIFTNEELFNLTSDARNKLSTPTRLRVPRTVVRPVDALDLSYTA